LRHSAWLRDLHTARIVVVPLNDSVALRFDRTIKPNRIEGSVGVDKLRHRVSPGDIGSDHAPRDGRVKSGARLDVIRLARDAFQRENNDAIGWLDGGDALADADRDDRETLGDTQ